MKTLLMLALSLIAITGRAAVPTLGSFEPSQFATNGNMVRYLAVWTNDLAQIHPAQANDGVTMTNFTHYGALVLPDKVTLLTVGTNVLNMATNSAWLLYSPTNDAAQVVLSLTAGAFQGQLAFIQSQNSDGAFTLPDLSEQDDVPGAYVDISGDWIATTNRGIILRYVAPDWVEASRVDPSSTNGPFAGGTTINPTDLFLPFRTNSTTFADSTLKQISNNEWHSFGATGRKITQAIGGNGTSTFERLLIGNAAVDPFIGLSLVGNLVATPVSINIDGVNAPLATHLVYIGSTGGAKTITNTPSLLSAYEINGAHSIFIGKSDVNTVTFQDQSVLPGSHLLLNDSTRTLGSNDVLQLVYLSAITNWVEIAFDDGTGGGSPLWASSSGNLFPSPAVDVVSITSQSASSATNKALIVNSGNWTDPESILIAAQRNGTNKMQVTSVGTVVVGAHTLDNWPVADGHSFISIMDPTQGDPALFEMLVGVFDAGSANVSGLEVYGGTNINQMVFYAGSTNGNFAYWRIFNSADPALVSDVNQAASFTYNDRTFTELLRLAPEKLDGEAPYIFGTAAAHTTNNLVEVDAPIGTHKFTLDYAGNGFFAGNFAFQSSTGTNVFDLTSPAANNYLMALKAANNSLANAVIMTSGTTSGDNSIAVAEGGSSIFGADNVGVITSGSYRSGDPGSGTGAWKLGTVVTGAVTASTTNYVEVSIEGTVVKLIKAN